MVVSALQLGLDAEGKNKARSKAMTELARAEDKSSGRLTIGGRSLV